MLNFLHILQTKNSQQSGKPLAELNKIELQEKNVSEGLKRSHDGSTIENDDSAYNIFCNNTDTTNLGVRCVICFL